LDAAPVSFSMLTLNAPAAQLASTVLEVDSLLPHVGGVGRFALPGASASSSCISSVSVIVSVDVRVLRFEFDEKTSYDLKTALSIVANKSHEHIIIKTAEQSSRGTSTVVVSSISTENEVDADYVARKLDTESVYLSLESHGLDGSIFPWPVT
jgi:hypothetical protein